MAVTVTLIILILVLPGCNQKTKRIENTLRVSVVTYTHDDPFINATVDELKEELKKRETEEWKIITSVRSADNDQKAQNAFQGAGHNVRQRFLLQHQSQQHNQAN